MLSPTFSLNSNKNFKNIENMLKNEHLNIIVSKIKNLNHMNRTKKFDFGFKYDYNNFINTNSFSNFYMADPKNILESPMNIYNVSNNNVVNSINYMDFSSSSLNNTRKHTLRRVFDNYNKYQDLISSLANKKENDNLNIKVSPEKVTKNEVIFHNKASYVNLDLKECEIIDKIGDEIQSKIENHQENLNKKSNDNDDLNMEIINVNPEKDELQPISIENFINEAKDQNMISDKENKAAYYINIKDNNDEEESIHKIKQTQTYLNNYDANDPSEKNQEIHIPEMNLKKDKNEAAIINIARNDSSSDLKKLKLIRPVSVFNAGKRYNNYSVNNTTNQSNIENFTEMNFISNQNQFLLTKNNIIEEKADSKIQNIKKDDNINTDLNQNFSAETYSMLNKNSNKIDREINAHLDGSNKLISIKIKQVQDEIKNLNKKDSKKKTTDSLFNYKNNKAIAENNVTRKTKSSGINFSNSILNKITTTNYNSSSNDVNGKATNINNNPNHNYNQVKIISINSPIYNAKLNCYENTDSSNFPRFNSNSKSIPDINKTYELNFIRLGLKTVKTKIPFYQNVAEKNFNEKFKVVNLSNTCNNGLKRNYNISIGDRIDSSRKNLRNAIDVKKISANI